MSRLVTRIQPARRPDDAGAGQVAFDSHHCEDLPLPMFFSNDLGHHLVLHSKPRPGARPRGAHPHRVHLQNVRFFHDGFNPRWFVGPVGIPAQLREC